MTKNVFVFGNSHIAALRDGYQRHEGRWPDMNLTFIGAYDMGLAETACEDGILRPISDGAKASFENLAGVETVDLRDADAIVIAGGGFAVSRTTWHYLKARWAALPSVQANPAPSKDWTLISEQAFTAVISAMLKASLGPRFVDILRTGCDAPIYLCSQPRSKTNAIAPKENRLKALRIAMQNGDAEAVSAMHENIAQAVCDQIGISYIGQTPQTIKDHLLTADPFTKGAIRLSKSGRTAQPAEDLIHANATYGKVVLDQVQAALKR